MAALFINTKDEIGRASVFWSESKHLKKQSFSIFSRSTCLRRELSPSVMHVLSICPESAMNTHLHERSWSLFMRVKTIETSQFCFTTNFQIILLFLSFFNYFILFFFFLNRMLKIFIKTFPKV